MKPRTLDCLYDQPLLFAARHLHVADPALELLIRLLERVEQEIDVVPWIVLALVPTVRAELQDFVIPLLVLLDQSFQANVAPYLNPGVIRREEEQQPRGSPVPVAERMDAEKIEIEHSQRDQRVDAALELNLPPGARSIPP